MGLYVFSSEELCMTAMFSRWETVEKSPLLLAEAVAAELKDDKAVDEYIKSLIETGMLLLKNDGSIIPSGEADMFLRILQDPDQVIQISRLGLANMKDYFLCNYGNLWCIYGISTDGKLHFINFPVYKENLPDWFKSDIISDFSPDINQRTKLDFTLNLVDNILLLCAQNVYAGRVGGGSPLSEDALWFTTEDLIAHKELKPTLLGISLFCSTEQLEELEHEFSSTEKCEAALLQLAKRGILETKKSEEGMTRFSYGEMLKEWLNPGGLVDVVLIRQSIPEAKGKTLYLKRNGYLMLEQTNDGMRYKTIKDGTDIISLVYGILDF